VRDSATGPFVFKQQNEAPPAFPKIGDVRFSPFWEAYLQGELVVNDDLSFTAGIQHRDNVLYHEGNGIPGSDHPDSYRASTLMLETVASPSANDNIHAIVELQNVFDSKKIAAGVDSLGIDASDGHYDNLLLTLEYTRSPEWAVNTRIEVSNVKNEQGGRTIWPVLGVTYRLGTTHTIGIQYGSERGGTVCTGGVCRLINPFTGFRLNVVSKL
jgi:hypothetical protein